MTWRLTSLGRPRAAKHRATPLGGNVRRIDQATVTVQAFVGVDGEVLSTVLLTDPGYGFGRAAADCLLQKRLRPALDRNGNPVASSAPVTVRFTR
jgi:periplasmic protein TonB